ncbi:MAG: extracellular solute-binding protein [Candidatus Cellulosilyticum pullistercoris]|uniref:Extracellular solute-binding protein n=1 Tax=Candidatus Cellulosilyticum pullistercoris TaxID=2838521 RepID=A0A9E2KCP0_9FIRM|nr:extracellular solute-binding protein [Candidatus Cellulosilyticum pullistercoris]
MKKWIGALTLISVMLTGMLTGCGGNNESVEMANGIGGTLTVVTGRTDAEELFAKIEADFIARYPEVTDIIWESSTDYDNYITTRMNTTDYGDVLMVPFSMSGSPDMYPNYFEPLGKVEELSEAYIDVTEADYEGIAYGLPTAINSLGIIYNTEVFEAAGITSMPTSVEELLEACQKIKENTDAIPFFTNYNTGLGVWGGTLTSFGGDQYKSAILEKGTAFEEGQPIREVMDLFYELASNGYTEQDPVTMDFAQGKQMLAEGKIAMMMKGSQDAKAIAELAGNSEAIKIAPLPVMFEGKTSIAFGAPEVMGINVNSDNKETARAFLDFFISAASGYADDLGGMSPAKADFTPEEKELFENNNIVLTAGSETPETEALYSSIANEVGVARLTDVLQQVVNMGLYPDQYESYADYVSQLETKWAQAVNEYAK